MIIRQIPKDLEQKEFEYKISFLESFIGTNWLYTKRDSCSIFKQLWNRRDYNASIELYTIADAIYKFRIYKDWLSNYRKIIKSNKYKDIADQTYEIISASMFHCGDQIVVLCDVNNPGYDFEIKIKEKKIRVSCKKLLIFDSEKVFKDFSKKLYEDIREFIKNIKLNAVQIVLININCDKKIRYIDFKSQIYMCLQRYKLGEKVVGYKIGGYFLKITDLPMEDKGFKYSQCYPSFKFICISPFLQEEQKRLENLFRQAAKNLKKHCGKIDTNNINMIMIGLPHSISISTAKNWLENKFTHENTSITAVLLTRIIIVSGDDLKSSHIQNEVALITNPNAKVRWMDFIPENVILKGQLNFGTVTEVESELKLISGEEKINLENSYVFQKGEVYLEHILDNFTFEFKNEPDIKYNLILRQSSEGILIEPILPPNDEVVVL